MLYYIQELSFQKGDLVLLVSDLLMVSVNMVFSCSSEGVCCGHVDVVVNIHVDMCINFDSEHDTGNLVQVLDVMQC